MMSEQLDRLGIKATRIPAVDARLLAKQKRRRDNGAPEWRIDPGSVANILSQSKAMISLLGSDASAALILEDDAMLAPDTPLLLDGMDWWPRSTHIIRLEDVPRYTRAVPQWLPNGRTPNGRAIRRMEGRAWGSAAYMIDRRGAQIALAAFADPDLTFDHILFDHRHSRTARRLRPMQVIPAMARQCLESESDQQQWRREAELQGIARRLHRLRRNLRALPYKARVLALRGIGAVQMTHIAYSELSNANLKQNS